MRPTSINHQRVAARAGNESTESIVRVLNISLDQFSRKGENVYIYIYIKLYHWKRNRVRLTASVSQFWKFVARIHTNDVEDRASSPASEINVPVSLCAIHLYDRAIERCTKERSYMSAIKKKYKLSRTLPAGTYRARPVTQPRTHTPRMRTVCKCIEVDRSPECPQCNW